MENLIKRIGLDKLAHLGWGGWIAALFTIVLMLQDITAVSWSLLGWPVAGLAVAAVFALMKEVVDGKFDWKDILWTLAGAATVFIAVAVGIALNIASH